MNRKFYFGLFLIAAGSSALGGVFALYLKHLNDARKTEDSPTVSGKEILAHLYALKVTLAKAENGDYGDAPGDETAIQRDFEFYKIAYLLEN